jgi:hypothetical protein
MNNEVKILLTINLEGGTLEKGEPIKGKYYLSKKDLFPWQKFKGNEGQKIIKSGKYSHTPLIPKDAKKRIKLTKDAYDYMTSVSCPDWFKNPKVWKKMKPEERLELHLARICRAENGKSFSYEIVPD